MTTTAILMREINTMSEEAAVELLDFAMFLKNKYTTVQPKHQISIQDAYGIFKDLKGIDATIDRDEEDRI